MKREIESGSVGHLEPSNTLKGSERPNSIVFIHGLSGSAKSTWSAMTRLFQTDERFCHHTIDYYQYPTRKIRLPLTPPLPNLSDLAHGLRTLIEEKHGLSPISIVAHSLGGLVARQYIVDCLKRGRPLTVNHLVLISVPNTGASLANVANRISFDHFQLKVLKKDSDALRRLNIDWLSVSAEKAVDVKYIAGGSDGIVTHSSASPYAGVESTSLLIEADHGSIVKPVDHQDIRYLAVSNFLLPRVQVERVNAANERSVLKFGDPLFDIYTPAHEPFYCAREFDAVLGDVVAGSHVWLTGRSGCGKSAALRRVVSLSGWRLLHINLATHEAADSEAMIEALIAELFTISEVGGRLRDQSSSSNRIRQLKLALEAQSRDDIVGVVVEEIPLPPAELRRFLQSMATVAELMGSEAIRAPQIRMLF